MASADRNPFDVFDGEVSDPAPITTGEYMSGLTPPEPSAPLGESSTTVPKTLHEENANPFDAFDEEPKVEKGPLAEELDSNGFFDNAKQLFSGSALRDPAVRKRFTVPDAETTAAPAKEAQAAPRKVPTLAEVPDVDPKVATEARDAAQAKRDRYQNEVSYIEDRIANPVDGDRPRDFLDQDLALARKKLADADAEYKRAEEIRSVQGGGFVSSVARGFSGALEAGAAGVKQYGADIGSDRLQRFGETAEGVLKAEREAMPRPRIESYQDIGASGNFWRDVREYAISKAGEGAGSTLPFVAGGVVAGGPGLVASAASMGHGTMVQALDDEGITDPEARRRGVYLWGSAVGALDAAIPEVTMLRLSGALKTMAVENVAKAIAGSLKTAAVSGGGEMATEMAQEYAQEFGTAEAAGRPVDWEATRIRAIDAGIAALLPGVGFSAPESAVRIAKARTGKSTTDTTAEGATAPAAPEAAAPAETAPTPPADLPGVSTEITVNGKKLSPEETKAYLRNQGATPETVAPGVSAAEPPAELSAIADQLAAAAEGLDEETAGPALAKLAAAQRNRKAKSPEAAAKAATAAADRAAAVAKGAAAPAAAPSLEDIGAMIRQATPDQRAKAAKVAGKAGALGKTMADIAAEQAGGQSAVDRVAGRGGRTAEVSTPETVAPAETPQKRIAFEQELSSLKSKAKVAVWAERNGYEVSDEEMDLPAAELKKRVLDQLAPAAEAPAAVQSQPEVAAPQESEPAPVADTRKRLIAKTKELQAKAKDAQEYEAFDDRLVKLAEMSDADVAKLAAKEAPQAKVQVSEGAKPAKKGPLGKRLADITAEQSGGQAAVERVAQIAPVEAAPEFKVTKTTQIVTPGGEMEVSAREEIVDLADLKPATGKLQPRDRSRAESQQAIRERANALDPEQLRVSRVSDTGAPLVSADGTVISGNGRVASIRTAYEQNSERAKAYRDSLGDAAKGMKMPVRISRLDPSLSQDDLVRLADLSNRSRMESMSATERAVRDARAAGPEVMALYQGGAFTATPNRDFLEQFIGKAVAANERQALSQNGEITKEGTDRLNAAVLASAYDDVTMLSVMLESTDDNIRSITGAMRDAAGRFAQLKADIANGVVRPDMDVTPYLTEAARVVADLRRRKIKLANWFAQADAFSKPSAEVEFFIRLFYDESLNKAISQEKLTDALIAIAEEARRHQDGGLFADETTAIDVLNVGRRRISAEADQASLFGSEGDAGRTGGEVRPGAQQSGAGTSSGEVETAARDLRSRFYDVLEGKARRSDWAKELGVSEADLAPLIKEALSTEVNWLREQNKGIFRVAKAKRGPRPAFDVAMDEIGQAAKAAPPTVDAAAGGKGKATLSSEIKARHKYRDDIARGNSVNVPPKTAKAILKAVKPHMEIFPKGVEVGALRYVDPADEGKAIGTFEMTDGSFREIVLDRDTFESVRAFRDPVTGNVFIVRFGDFAAHNFETLFGELRHEHVHVLRSGQIGPRGDLWSRLVSHAKSLDLLDMDVGTYLQMVGSDTGRNAKPESLLDRYTKLYGTRRDFAEIMDQEHVAHFRELAYHNQLLPEQIAPVQDILDIMDSGIFGRAAETLEPDDPLYALAQQATDLSKLGYYSLALRAARDLKQAKGTAEQMLAQLKTAGVKDSEIKATGLDRFLSDKKSVTRDEITSYLAAHAVEVREVSYGGGISTAFATPEEAGRMLAEQRGWTGPVEVQLSGRDLGIDLGYYRVLGNGQELGAVTRQDGKFYVGGENIKTTPAKWSEYALDGSNPSYRESVLHLPSDGQGMPSSEKAKQYLRSRGFNPEEDWGYTNPNDYVGAAIGRGATEAELAGDPIAAFYGGHWSEPNVISHIRSSLQKDEAGRSVFLIDELQSDWGQRVRDGGARDEAKIDDLKKRLKEKLGEHASAARMALSIGENLKREGKLSGPWSNADVARLSPEFAEVSRLNAELLTAESAVTSHPLVSTTDQWVQTSLRRILMKAVEAGADAVSFTPGKVQAARYSLGGQVDEIMYSDADGVGELNGQRKGDNVFYKDGITAADLPEYVGKSVAEKLLAAKPDADGFRRISGVDLEMGGEGMRATYDSIYPKTLAKILGKFDKTIKPDHRKLNSSAGKPLADKGGKEIDFITFPLTEEAKAKIAEGLPLFALSSSRPPLDMSPEARKARAEEMGFDTSFVAYRGMKGEYSDSVAGSLDYQFFARDPSVASEYAENGVVVPVWLRLGRGLTINARGQPFYGIDPRSLPLDIHRTAREIADEIAKKSRSQPTIDAEVLARAAKASGYESLTIRNVIDNFDLNNEKRSTIHVVFSPSNIRSTNAAFDPALDGENGLLYAIGGPLAKTAPKASLAVAERMETRKGTPETIQRATGWFRGPDGKWRWEIDDSKAQVKNLDKNLQVPARSLFRKATGMPAKTQPKWAKGPVKLATNIALKDILDHAALFKAYPFLEKMRVNMIIGEGVPAEKEKAALVFRKEGGQLVFSPIVVRAKTTKDILPILLHEVQHYIQIKEGFAGGSSPSTNTAPPTGKLDFSKSGEQVSYKGRTFSADTKRNQATTGSRGPAAEDWSNVASKTIPLTRAEQLALRIAEAHTELTAPHPADYPLSPKDRRETIQDQISRDQAEMVHLLTVGPQDYADSIGEKESRAVEARLRMSPDERKGAPVDYGDVTGLGQSTINFADAANETLRRAELTKTLVDIKRRKRIDVAPGIVARHAWHDADWLQFSVDFKKGQDGYTFSAAIDPDSGRALVELADLGYDDGLGWPTEDGDGRKRPMPMVRLNEALDAVETYLRSLNLTPVHDPRLYPATAPQGKVDAELNDAELEQWRSYRPEGKSNRYDYGAPVEAKPDENVSDAEFAFWKKRDPYYRLDDARSMKGGEDVVVMPGDLATAGLDPAIWKARMSDDHYLSSAQLIIKMSEAQKELRKKLAEGASSEEANAFARRISDMQADYTLALAREKDAPIELSADQLVSREDDGGGLLYAIGAPLEQKVPKPLSEIMADLKDTTGTTTTQQLYGLSVFVRDARNRLRQVLRLKPNSRGMAAEVTGQYDRAGGVTRMRSSGDIATLTHEAAHHLETTFGDALAGLMGTHKAELEPLASPGGDALSEGFAEWFSVYVRDPDTAWIEAPTFYEAFEELLDAENPAMLEGLQRVQEDYAEYLTADPVARGTANVQSSAPAGLIERTARAMGGVTQTLDLVGRTASNWFLDRAHPVRAVVKTMLKLADANGVRDANGRRISLKVWENPYKIARMIPGGYKSGHMMIIKGVPDYGTFDISGPSLQDAVAFAMGSRRKGDWTRQNLDRFGLYLIARRAMAEHDRYTTKIQGLKTLAQTSEQARAMRSAASEAATRLAAQVETRQRRLVANRAQLRQIEQELKLSERRYEDLGNVADMIDTLPSDRQTRVAGLRSATASYITRYREERASLTADIATTETELTERQNRLDMLRNSLDGLDQVIEANAAETKRLDKTGPNRPPTREPRAYYAQIKASLDQQFPQYAEAAKMVAEWQRRLLTFERDAGRWSEEAYQGLIERSDWYVPFMRKMDDLDTEGSVSPKNKSNIKKFQQAKRFKGSDRDIINPIESMMERAYSTGMASMFNDMIGSLANLAERVGPGGRAIAERVSRTETVSGTPDVFEQLRQQAIALGMDEYEATMLIQRFEQDFSDTDLSLVWAPDRVGPGKVLTLPLWEDGKRNAVRLNDPKFSQDLFDAIQGLSHQQLNLVTRIMGAPARLLSRGVVSHPAFVIPNIVRDALASSFVTGAPPLWTQAKGIYYELGESTLGSRVLRSLGVTPPTVASTYQAAGGIMGGQMTATMSALKDKVAVDELRRRGFHFANWKQGLNPVSEHNWAQVASEMSETATRLGVFAYALKRAKRLDPTMTDFDAVREAAFTARDVMDFDRRGSKMLSLAHIIAFLNPALQGVSVATRTLRGESDRGSAFMQLGRLYWRNERGERLSTDDQAALVQAGKMMMFASIYAALVLLAHLLQEDDDEYKEIQETTSSRDLPVKIGGQWYRIPKPFEFALPANMLIAGVDYARSKDPRLFSRWADQFKDNVLPPAAPQIMTLVGGYMYNTDAFGNDIVNMGEQRLPAVMQFDNYTSQLAIEMSLAADRVGVPLSPEMIDFTLTTAGGYWGKDIKLASDQLSGRAGESIQDQFLIGPLTSRLSINLNRSSAGRSEFWNLMGQAGGEYTAAAAGYKKVIESGASALMSPERYLSRLAPEEQAYAILKVQFEGDGKTQRFHPLERAKKVMEHYRDISKEIIISGGVTDGSVKVAKGEPPETIPIGPAHGAEIRDILGRLQMMEAANSLIAIGHDQWAMRKPFDTQLVWDELRASSPEVADELERRIEKDGIEDYAVIAKAWPSLRDMLLKDTDLSKADLKAELQTVP